MKPPHLCFHLGNKAYFFPPPLAEDERESEPLTTPFWCTRTHEPLGPDGEVVDSDCCCAGRACYQPEVQL